MTNSLYQQVVETELKRISLRAEIARRTAAIMDETTIFMARPEENFVDPEKGYSYTDIDHRDGQRYYNFI